MASNAKTTEQKREIKRKKIREARAKRARKEIRKLRDEGKVIGL